MTASNVYLREKHFGNDFLHGEKSRTMEPLLLGPVLPQPVILEHSEEKFGNAAFAVSSLPP